MSTCLLLPTSTAYWCLLFTVYYLLFTVYWSTGFYLLFWLLLTFTVFYLLSTVYGLLPVSYWGLLPADCYRLPATGCLLPAACCLLPAACCLLPVVDCFTGFYVEYFHLCCRLSTESRPVTTRTLNSLKSCQKILVKMYH